MKIPDPIFEKLKENLWSVADAKNWPTLPDSQKTALYEEWIRDEQVGGILSRYIAPPNVRVYIKDTIMKPYGRERIKDFARILAILKLPRESDVVETYIKPHGRRLADGKVICWGLSRDWKSILFAVFERSFKPASRAPFAAVILSSAGRCQQPTYRELVETAAKKLGVQHLVWYDA